MANPYKFRKNIDIGSLDAENDKFLISAFVNKNDVSLIQDINDRKCIILGRTGSGKSAIIKYLIEKEKHIIRIDPESMSLRHLSNSDIINYFKKLDVKLDLFYKVLWKHVFIVELIKLRFENNLSKSQNILEWIKEHFPDKRRKKAIDYLENWEDKFWEDTEYRIKELETSLEKRFKGEFGGDLNLKELIDLSAKSEVEQKSSNNVKYEVLNKAQKVVNESQIEQINDIVSMMKSDIFNKVQKKYIIVIDDLDKEWVSNKIVYDLIKALIETIKDLSDIPNIKIVIALRSNIHKKIFKENVSRGVQREKYNHLYLDITWSKEELKELINNRLRELMKDTYTQKSPTVDDILYSADSKHPDGFDYILERTFMRPRDIIDFFNKCIKYADGKTKFTKEIIRLAEDEYSNDRLNAINDEWLENYGNLSHVYGFLKNCKNGFLIEEIKESAVEYFLEIIVEEKHLSLCNDLKNLFIQFFEDSDYKKLLRKLLIIMYEIGIVGIKLAPELKIDFVCQTYSALEESDFKENTKFYIHPMFHKAFKTISLKDK